MKNARGFTLIELVMVIVILGILAAVALPRFANLQGDAREASLRAAVGAVRSAMAITHSAALIAGTEANAADAANTVTLEGQAVLMAFGYPTVADIDLAAGLDAADYTVTAAGVITLTAGGGCSATYTAAPDAANAATIVIAAIPAAGC